MSDIIEKVSDGLILLPMIFKCSYLLPGANAPLANVPKVFPEKVDYILRYFLITSGLVFDCVLITYQILLMNKDY